MERQGYSLLFILEVKSKAQLTSPPPSPSRMASGGNRCDRTRSVKEPELCDPTVETWCLESVSHLGF